MKFDRKMLLAIAAIAMTNAASAAPWVYRGSLQDYGAEANGVYDLRLTLVDARGAAIQGPVTLYNVQVTKGSFTTTVDFGVDPNSFTGAKLFTEVQQGNSGFFSLGDAKAINGGAAECWDVDGNTGLTTSVIGATGPGTANLNITNGSADVYLRQNAGIEQDSSTASGTSSAAWGASTARGPFSFAVGRGIVGNNGTSSFAYSDATPAQTVGTPGFSDAPGEFLVRSAGGIGFNSAPGTSDFALGPRPGQADTDTLLHFNSNGLTSQFGLLSNGQTGIQAPATLFLQSVDGVGINALTADLGPSSFIDLAVRPKSSGSDGDADIAFISRDGSKRATLIIDQETGTFFIATAPNSGQPRLNMGGATLSNGGAWTNQSSRALKEGFAAIDGMDVLSKLVQLPITTWSYKGSGEGTHMGPTAEDFKAVFGLAGDGKSIGTVDADGVALAAIQGLNAKLEAENAELRARLERIELQLGAR